MSWSPLKRLNSERTSNITMLNHGAGSTINQPADQRLLEYMS
jgi:hypothetical protein